MSDDMIGQEWKEIFQTVEFAQILINLMEEAKDPGRDLPRATYISFFIITLEFTLVNLAYFVVLSPAEILSSETVAIQFFHKFYPPFKPVISILVAITAIGVLNASVLGHSRVLFAGARNNQAPVIFGMIHSKFYTPWPSVLLISLWALVMLFSGGLFMMIEYISLFSIIMSAFTVSAQLYLRWTAPRMKRPYKAPLFIPVSQIIMLLLIFVLSVYQEPYKLGRALLILAAGAPVYVIGVKWKKPKAFQLKYNGFFSLMSAAELATMFPTAGGPYAYIKNVFGPFLGFMTLWGYLCLITGPFWALMGYTSAIYLIQPFYSDCKPPTVVVKLLAAWILVTCVAINCVYVKFVTKIQTILSLTKLLSLLMIIVCGMFQYATGDVANGLVEVWEGTTDQPSVIALSIMFSVFNYVGWQVLISLMEEAKDPGRDLPRAIYLGFFVITVEFTLVNLAYFVVLSPAEILSSETVAIQFFHRFYPPFKPVISILVAITSIGVLNASVLGHSRVLFAGARYDQAPLIFAMIHSKFYTPWPSIMLMSLWALVMLFSGGLFMMIEYISLFFIILSAFGVSAQLYLRWTEPRMKRPYKAPLFIPVSQIIMLLLIFVLSVYQEPYKLGRALLILVTGGPVYVIGVKWKKPKAFQVRYKNFTVNLQKLLMVRKSA